MRVEEVKFEAYKNRYEIYGFIMYPDCEAKGILHIVHGMKEHIRRYEEFAGYMAEKGFIVCGCDMAGHGRSVGEDGKFGYFGETDGYISLLNDVYTMYKVMRDRFGNIAYYLMGHSMGSFIARQFCVEFADRIRLNGAIFSGTGYMNPVALTIAIRAADFFIVAHGKGKESPFFDKFTFGSYNKPFASENSSSSWLSRDRVKIEEYQNDTLNRFNFTHAGYRDLFYVYRSVSVKGWAEKMNKDMPVYFFSGDRDPVGKFGRGVVQVCTKLHKMGHEKVTLKLYKDGRHEMLNEINRREVYEDVYNWIAQINEKSADK